MASDKLKMMTAVRCTPYDSSQQPDPFPPKYFAELPYDSPSTHSGPPPFQSDSSYHIDSSEPSATLYEEVESPSMPSLEHRSRHDFSNKKLILQELFRELEINFAELSNFYEEEIFKDDLPLLQPDDLEKLLPKLGPRRRLQNWIAETKQSSLEGKESMPENDQYEGKVQTDPTNNEVKELKEKLAEAERAISLERGARQKEQSEIQKLHSQADDNFRLEFLKSGERIRRKSKLGKWHTKLVWCSDTHLFWGTDDQRSQGELPLVDIIDVVNGDDDTQFLVITKDRPYEFRALSEHSRDRLSSSMKKMIKRAKDIKTLLRTEAKLILLGTSSGGKSTLFKQFMVSEHGKGFSQTDKIQYKRVLQHNGLHAMQTLIENAKELNNQIMDAAQKQRAENVAETCETDVISRTLANDIFQLWKDTAICRTFRQQNKFQLCDNSQFTLDNIQLFSEPSYLPPHDHIMQTRVRTTGILEAQININGRDIRIFDVGAERNERKKWMYCAGNATAVVFVVAISEYDQKLWEDERQNRMHESLECFRDVCNSQHFKDLDMFIFFNKIDILEKKVRVTPLRVCFEDYDGDNSFQSVCDFVKNKFLEIRSTNVFVHFTCALDTKSIQPLIHAIKDQVELNAVKRYWGFVDVDHDQLTNEGSVSV